MRCELYNYTGLKSILKSYMYIVVYSAEPGLHSDFNYAWLEMRTIYNVESQLRVPAVL